MGGREPGRRPAAAGRLGCAEAELTQAADADQLADQPHLSRWLAMLAALRGDAGTAESKLVKSDLRAIEDPQDKALISILEGFIAAARRQPHDALRHARAALGYGRASGGPLGMSNDAMIWAWPLASRPDRSRPRPYHLAHGLLDHAEHLALLDPEAAEAAVSEARDIAARLRCQPLLDRTARLTPARPPTQV